MPPRHPELVSGSSWSPALPVANWTLKRVQGDDLVQRLPRPLPVAAVEVSDRDRQLRHVVERVHVEAPRFGVRAGLVEALHAADRAEEMVARAGAEAIVG